MLKKNGRPVYAGKTALRAPDGSLLTAVPQYMTVPVDKADPASIEPLHKNERLVEVGTVLSRSEPFGAQTLYIKEPVRNIDPKTELLKAEEKACDALIADLVAYISKKTLEGQGGAR